MMYLFSFVDKSSFDDIPHNMGRFSGPKDNTCKIIMGTKYPFLYIVCDRWEEFEDNTMAKSKWT